MMAQQAMQKGSKLKHEDSHNLDFYFDKVLRPQILDTKHSLPSLSFTDPLLCQGLLSLAWS